MPRGPRAARRRPPPRLIADRVAAPVMTGPGRGRAPYAHRVATVLLLRHGRTTSNADGTLAGRTAVALDEAGLARRAAVGERLRDLPLAEVVTSPLKRCRQTLSLALPGVRPHVEYGLVECGYGEWEGQKLRTLAKEPLWRVVQAHPSAVTFPVASRWRRCRPGRWRRFADWDDQVTARARAGRAVAGLQPRRRDQGDRGRRARPAPRPVPADRGRPGIGDGHPVHPGAAVPRAAQRHRRPAWPASSRPGAAVTAEPARPDSDAAVGGGAGRVGPASAAVRRPGLTAVPTAGRSRRFGSGRDRAG